jgi:MoaA/NifB/PqqE/SkfB family radical SAM enzyme
MTGEKLHFGGGEPFFDYSHLIQCFEAAKEERMLPLGKLETNGFWCKTEKLARKRLETIKRFGVRRLAISSDVFHQEFIPVATVRRAVRLGREILGRAAVTVNTQEFLDDPVEVSHLPAEQKTEIFRSELRRHPWRIMGRAADHLSHLVEKQPKKNFAGKHCAWKMLGKRSIHIDPYGNIFPSVCAGIIVGNAKQEPLSQICTTFELDKHPMVKTLAERGPLPLLEEAIASGLAEDKSGYASKCHACYAARAFFSERGMYADEVGPREVYAD